MCNPGGLSVDEGSFRCALVEAARLQMKGESAEGRKEEVGGLREKESLIRFFMRWLVTLQNLSKSH